MKRRYLNSRNKQNVLLLACMNQEAKNMVESFNLEGEWKRKANTIATFAEKLMYHVIEHLDEEQRKQLTRLVNHYEVKTVQTSAYTKKEEEESDEYLATFAEYAINGACTKCEREDFEKCDLRTALIHACMPVFDECAEGCPYKVQT